MFLQEILDEGNQLGLEQLSNAQLVGLLAHQYKLPTKYAVLITEEVAKRKLSTVQIAALQEEENRVTLVDNPTLLGASMWRIIIITSIGLAFVGHSGAWFWAIFLIVVTVRATKRGLSIHPSAQKKTWSRVEYSLLIMNMVVYVLLLLV